MTPVAAKRKRKPKALLPFQAIWSPRGYTVEFPVITQTEGNANENRFTRIDRCKAQRTAAMFALKQLPNSEARQRIKRVRFVRFAPGELDLGDNLNSAFKHIRDQVVAWIAGDNTVAGRGDDGPRCGLTWEYAQVRSKEYGVRIEMTFEVFT